MANYELRADILNNAKDLYDDIAGCNRIRKLFYFGTPEQRLSVRDKWLYYAKPTLEDYIQLYGNYFVTEVCRLAECSYNRTERLHNKLVKICALYEQPIFITLTFDDNKVKPTTSIETRKYYAVVYMNSLGAYYVGNEDYGSQNDRYHLHFVFVRRLTKEEMNRWYESYGAIKVENIRNHTTSEVKLSRYINKLTNHAIKSTTKQSRLIYCRKYKLD